VCVRMCVCAGCDMFLEKVLRVLHAMCVCACVCAQAVTCF
jgi:hypothetical protein